MEINELCDDDLLMIFSHLNVLDRFKLKLVCKKWYQLSRTYTHFMGNQKALGFVSVQDGDCTDINHKVEPKDVIGNLFVIKRTNESKAVRLHRDKQVFRGKFDVGSNKDKLKRILKGCKNLRSLVLKYGRNIDHEAIEIITSSCPKLEHLDLSYSMIKFTFKTWELLTNRLETSLKHLHLYEVCNLDDYFLIPLMVKCQKLEDVVLSMDMLSGRSFHFFGHNLKRLQLDVQPSFDNIENVAEHALIRLSEGNGRHLEELHLQGRITLAALQFLGGQGSSRPPFPNLKSLTLQSRIEDVDENKEYKEVASALLGLFPKLESLWLDFPVHINFDAGFIELLRIGGSCLRNLRLSFSPLKNRTYANICELCPNLKSLSLVHMHDSVSQLPSDLSFAVESFAHLKRLRKLELVNVSINDRDMVKIIKSCDSLRYINLKFLPKIGDATLTCFIEKAISYPLEYFCFDSYKTGVSSAESNFPFSLPRNLKFSDTLVSDGCVKVDQDANGNSLELNLFFHDQAYLDAVENGEANLSENEDANWHTEDSVSWKMICSLV